MYMRINDETSKEKKNFSNKGKKKLINKSFVFLIRRREWILRIAARDVWWMWRIWTKEFPFAVCLTLDWSWKRHRCQIDFSQVWAQLDVIDFWLKCAQMRVTNRKVYFLKFKRDFLWIFELTRDVYVSVESVSNAWRYLDFKLKVSYSQVT